MEMFRPINFKINDKQFRKIQAVNIIDMQMKECHSSISKGKRNLSLHFTEYDRQACHIVIL